MPRQLAAASTKPLDSNGDAQRDWIAEVLGLMRYPVIAAACLVLVTQISSQSTRFEDALLRAVDLAVGESEEVVFSDGKRARVKLLDLQETRDQVCGAVRRAQVKVEINGQPATLVSATYHLPVTVAGVQIDCPITKGYNRDSRTDAWGLMKDARLRLWPAGSSWMPPGAFRYPVRQRWFASMTQMANEPTYVDGGEQPWVRKIYYHYGLDIGGSEGLVEVVAATDGLAPQLRQALAGPHRGDRSLAVHSIPVRSAEVGPVRHRLRLNTRRRKSNCHRRFVSRGGGG